MFINETLVSLFVLIPALDIEQILT